MAEIIEDNDGASGPKVFEFRRAGKKSLAEERAEAALQAERQRLYNAQERLAGIRFYSWVTGALFGLLVAVPMLSWLPWQVRLGVAAVLIGGVGVAAALASIAVRAAGLGDG